MRKIATIKLSDVTDFDSITGGGVRGRVDGKQVMIGKPSLLTDHDSDGVDALDDKADELQRQGHTVMYAAIDGEFAGLIAVSDPIKESTPEAVRTLHDMGLKVIMLTGDNEQTAKSVADQLGIDDYHAGVSSRRQTPVHQIA